MALPMRNAVPAPGDADLRRCLVAEADVEHAKMVTIRAFKTMGRLTSSSQPESLRGPSTTCGSDQ